MTVRQLALGLEFRPALGAEDFVVGKSNRDAVAWLDAWPAWPENGLVIYGPPASGKSHLVEVWRKVSGARVVAGAALRLDAVAELAQGAVAIEDLGPDCEEQALLHVLNLTRERGGSCLLTAAMPPLQWRIALADLRSRLLALAAVAVAEPDDALLEGVVQKLFADRRLDPGPGVIDYLMRHTERSLAAARAAVGALDAAALALARPVTVPLARMVLAQSGALTEQEDGSRQI